MRDSINGMQRPIPLRPDYAAAARNRGLTFERACLASIKASIDVEQPGAERVAKTLWPGDSETQMVLRAAVSPTDTTSGAAFALNTAVDFIGSLQPLSAAARLINLGLRVSLAGINSVNIPRRQGGKAATDVVWISQGSPIPTKQYTLESVTLGPVCKLPLLVPLTRELVEYAGGDEVITTLIREDLAASSDASMFSSTAAVAGVRPAGLFFGLTPITAAAAGADAMATDLEKLAGAVLNNGGSQVVYIASPKQAASIKVRLLSPSPPSVFTCPALAAGTVAAIEPNAFVSAFGPVPRISASKEATIEFDTTPDAGGIGSGTVPTIAVPTVSAWQTDLIIIRAILEAAWAMRATGMVALITGANWGA